MSKRLSRIEEYNNLDRIQNFINDPYKGIHIIHEDGTVFIDLDKLNEKIRKLREIPKWLKSLGRKLREYQGEDWWLIMQKLLKETYKELEDE